VHHAAPILKITGGRHLFGSKIKKLEGRLASNGVSTICYENWLKSKQLFDWMTPMGRLWRPVLFLTRGQALGAVFNQLVRSRAQLLVAE
jgi:hypothetical protein